MDRSVRDMTAAIAAGDAEALARLYRAWFDRMYAEARRRTGRDESFCLDVVQDAMLRVIRSLPVLPDEPALAAWLRRAVRSCAVDRLRRDARRARREEACRPRDPSRADDAGADRLAWLRSEVDALPEPARTLLTMRHRFGWTLARIGSAMGLRPGAVDGRIGRVIAGLRERAREELDE